MTTGQPSVHHASSRRPGQSALKDRSEIAHIVLAAVNEVVLTIARAGDHAAALRAGQSAIAGFLDRLLGDLVTPVAGI
jgi:hypothetical protein